MRPGESWPRSRGAEEELSVSFKDSLLLVAEPL